MCGLACRVTHALKKLRDHCPGVATGAVEQCIASICEHRAEMFFSRLAQQCKDGAQGQRKIGACVSVGDRKDVNAVEQILLSDNSMYAGD